MAGDGQGKYAKDESGDDSSDRDAEAFRNEILEVEDLGVGKIQGDQEHDTAEHPKKRVRRTGALHQGEKEQDRGDGQEKRLWLQRERRPSEICHTEGRDGGAKNAAQSVKDPRLWHRRADGQQHTGDEGLDIGSRRPDLKPHHLSDRGTDT